MKKRLLVYCDYRRKDLLLPLDMIADKFELHFIFFREREEDNNSISYPVLFWADYKTPYQLLKQLAPDGVIFFDLSNLYALSLNMVAKKSSLPTFILDHGLKIDYDFYTSIETKARSLPNAGLIKNGKAGKKLHLLNFYFSSINWFHIKESFRQLQLLVQIIILRSDKAFANVQFPLRKPGMYLLFSPQNFQYYKQRDGAELSEITYIGNPHFDRYYHTNGIQTGSANYFVLIDDGHIEVFGISIKQKNEFIEKLNSFCLGKNARLKIKLHPADFNRKDLFQHKNIDYLRTVDVVDLVNNATGCFAISSTLLLPLVTTGKLILFRLNNMPIQEVLSKYGVKFLDFHKFYPEEIVFEDFLLDSRHKAAFVETFLYKEDGKSSDRLLTALQEHT
jgi:hypothetical protein